MSQDFTGCKLAYLLDDKLLVYLRDHLPTIPFPGHWDLPGGGREGDESPEACILRELSEEFAITLPRTRLLYKRAYANHTNNSQSFFFAAQGTQAEIDKIRFGTEGQHWRMMPINEFISHKNAVPPLVARLNDYLANSK